MTGFRRFLSLQTPKNAFIRKAVGDAPFRILDVGSGNHSPSRIKALFPKAEYHGVDLDKSYGYDARDDAAMTAFYGMDLTRLEFGAIPDNYFDVITMAHIIEHLHNGDAVISALSAKLKKGGHIYIEYPGQRSTKLPSMHGSLNFYDDKTHVRVYSVPELKMLLTELDFKVLSGGTRRSNMYIAAIPFKLLSAVFRGEKPTGNIFWDLLGFAEYVFARKR